MEKRTETDVLNFVMGFVANAEKYKSQFLPKWQEVLANFLVEPYDQFDHGNPYVKARNGKWQSPIRSITLKDPETHKAVMTYASNLVKSLFGHRRREYISARPVGYEDWQKSATTSRLLRYAMSLPGSFRTWVEAVVDMLIFGTAIVEVQWRYEERERLVRTISTVDGIDLSDEQRMTVPSYDDVEITVIDPANFFPDPGEYRLDKMRGAAKKFKMTALAARDMARKEIYKMSAVEEAISDTRSQSDRSSMAGTRTDGTEWRDGVDQPSERESMSDFKEMVGYEYWGEVPWENDMGTSRRVITVLNGVVVRNEPFPLADNALPFHSLIINPVNGRFYGISPAEIIRYDQDFADALKILIATAVVRQVHPPMAFDSDSELDIAMLKRWKPDAIIPVRGGPSSIGTVRYDANVMNAFNMSALLKDSMQGTSGANGAVQGEEGPDREAATVGSMRMQAAMSRPELAAMVLENECLPPIGKAILNRYQQFLEDSDALALRIGEQPGSVWLGEIMGDYDVEFVGSRMAITRQQKLQSLDRMISLASVIPQVAQMVPWDFFLRDMIGETMELPDIAAQIGDPQTVLMNLLMQQMGGQPGASNGNGQPVSAEPAGALPGQMSGDIGE